MKTLIASCLGKDWDKLVIRMDVGACKGSLVGQSEQNMRNALKMAEYQRPCILFLDEFEKMFAGIGSSGFCDGGTTSNMYSTWLNWSQNRLPGIFVIAACNSIANVPAPALRRGRFDNIFFIDLPTRKERKEVLEIHLRRRKWDLKEHNIDVDLIAGLTDNFVPSELEHVVNDALINQYNDELEGKCNKKQLTVDHFRRAIEFTTPSWKTSEKEIQELRDWAKKHSVTYATSNRKDMENIEPADTETVDRISREIDSEE